MNVMNFLCSMQEPQYNIFNILNVTVMDKQFYQEQTGLFKALNHPVRLAILDVLRLDEACVCHLEAVLGQRQAYISQQLAVLREAGIIQDRRDGWNVYYQVTDHKIYEIIDLASQFIFGDRIPDHSFHLNDCPCPKCQTLSLDIRQTANSDQK